jgi:hypothetical protein
VTNAEQIEHDAKLLMKASASDLNDMLDSDIEIDENHTLTLREVIAKMLISISRSPVATKDTRKRALRLSKQYLEDSKV